MIDSNGQLSLSLLDLSSLGRQDLHAQDSGRMSALSHMQGPPVRLTSAPERTYIFSIPVRAHILHLQGIVPVDPYANALVAYYPSS